MHRGGLHGTELARAQCGTIPRKLLKNGALVSVSVRRIRLPMASGYPYAQLFTRALDNLRQELSPCGSARSPVASSPSRR